MQTGGRHWCPLKTRGARSRDVNERRGDRDEDSTPSSLKSRAEMWRRENGETKVESRLWWWTDVEAFLSILSFLVLHFRFVASLTRDEK